jgi:hypothetical protein
VIAWVAAALAGDCTDDLAAPPPSLSVAWISPVGRRVSSRGYLSVVPAGELRRWVAEERPGLGRVLQHLGERKRARDPRRRYKITIFDVSAADLCRPLDEVAEGTSVAGVAACPAPRSRVAASDGCGSWADAVSGDPTFPVYRVRWLDAARDGFCVLPAERFLQ